MGVTGTDGDINGDGNVDGRDYLKWKRDFPTLSADDLAKWKPILTPRRSLQQPRASRNP
jgi:hypothetical protein